LRVWKDDDGEEEKRSLTPDERKRTAAILRELRDETRGLRLQLERRQA
jgi:hypothetical protein